MPSDLHMHTTFSDGRLTPEELLAAAKTAGLSYMAITDHDTVEGISYLYENGLYPCKGIHIIPGIEFSAHHPTTEIHILGYNVDIYYRDLLDKLNDVTEARWTRFSEMIGKLQQLGYTLSEAEVLTIAGTSKSISRSHIARVLVKKGYFNSVHEAFDTVLMKGKPGYVSHFRLEVGEIIALIKAAGGTPVLAHPKLIGDDELVRQLCQQGIEGIQACGVLQTEEVQALAHIVHAQGADSCKQMDLFIEQAREQRLGGLCCRHLRFIHGLLPADG